MVAENTVTSSFITGSTFRRMVLSAGASITNNADTINDLNVFPVPDGDTGSNMSMTICSAVNDLRSTDNDCVGEVAALTASAMLRGARGNSGVILSLLFRGMSKELKGITTCDGIMWANALKAGVEAAYKAVSCPAEGTILTVARIAAEKAVEAANKVNDFEYVLDAASDAASEALANTVNQNPVLKKAGVVDAGGMGWVVALNAMKEAVHGDAPDFDSYDTQSTSNAPQDKADFSDFDTEDIKFTYCTEFIVSRENELDATDFRRFLSDMGDSLVMVDDEEIIKVHIHTNAPGTVMQEALKYGSFVSVKVENMKMQHSSKLESEINTEIASYTKKEPSNDYGVVAVCPGNGIAETFISLGADGTISGGQTMNPSTEDILTAIEAVNAKTVFVLPNNKNIIMAANQAATISTRNVIVIPSRSIPEGIAAMQGYDIDLQAEEIERSMNDMAASADTMQITYAARDSEFDGMSIAEGDYLALYGGKLAGNGKELDDILLSLADKALEAGKELITVYYGSDVTEEDAKKAMSIFSEKFGEDNVVIVNGGQPVYYYIISAE